MMIPGQHDCRHSQDDSHLQLGDIYQATHWPAQHPTLLSDRDEGDQCRPTDQPDQDITTSSNIPQNSAELRAHLSQLDTQQCNS